MSHLAAVPQLTPWELIREEARALLCRFGLDAVGFRRDTRIPGVLADTPEGVVPIGPELADANEASAMIRTLRRKASDLAS